MNNINWISKRAIALMCLFCIVRGCPILKDKVPGHGCECRPLDDSRGWFYTCIRAEDGYIRILHVLEYRISKDGHRTIQFNCVNNETNYESILQQIDNTDVQTYIFISCPLPNVSYGNFVNSREDYPLREIRIPNSRDNRSFSAEIFEPVFKNLKSLELKQNGIEELPESIFTNFSKLQNLTIADNSLKTLPEKIFHPLPQLLSLEITNNFIESLPENVFDCLFQLQNLIMYKNHLKYLPRTIFKNLLNLQVLDFGDNKLMSLPPDIFIGLSQIKHIRLQGNWLRTLPKELFSYTLNIEEIDLGINKFIEPLPESLLKDLSHLKTFKIEDCNISYIHEPFFEYSPNLTNLYMDSNSIKELPEKIFYNNTMLKILNLNFNKIQILRENLLFNQKYLEKLSLFDNNIREIPEGFFKNTRSIKTLVLGQNKIKEFTQKMFRDLPNLESIDLSKNRLTEFMLDFNPKMEYIFLSNNNIKRMPSLHFQSLLKLETLDLQYNKITFVDIPVIYNLNKGKSSINLSHNNITTVNVYRILLNDNNLHELASKNYEAITETTIYLNSNPFNCNCKLYEFFHYLTRSNYAQNSVRFSMINNLICNEPPRFHNKPILKLKADEFTCELKENCSSPCNCYYRIHDDSTILNCSDHRLKTIPQLIPYNTSILYFKNNSLTSMSELNSEKWANLTEVYLDNNRISNINDWDIPSNLKFLSLTGNRLRQLPDSFLNLTSAKEELFMNLSRNPWTCNCSTTNFKTWLAGNSKNVPDAKDVLCSQRLKQNGSLERMSVLGIAGNVMCPLNDWPYRVQNITVSTVCAVLTLSLLIVLVLYYRNKQTIIAYLYIHMHPLFCFIEEDFDEDKIFDAFVAYGHDDCDVAYKLIDELEPHFRLCIHERDWIAGNKISCNIFNSVQYSRRTILVISKEFLKSKWFEVEFCTAYCQMLEEKINRLIIIVKGDLPPKETLDSDLLFMLSTKTYLTWEERWFWEKLRYAMPHKKSQPIQRNVLALKDMPDREKIIPIDNQIATLLAKSNRETDKAQEVVHNGTNRALN